MTHINGAGSVVDGGVYILVPQPHDHGFRVLGLGVAGAVSGRQHESGTDEAAPAGEGVGAFEVSPTYGGLKILGRY